MKKVLRNVYLLGDYKSRFGSRKYRIYAGHSMYENKEVYFYYKKLKRIFLENFWDEWETEYTYS